MRIQSLRLLKFGPFDGEELRFERNTPALHVIYGLNEAGKSSTLRAITQLLFGIPHQSEDNFRHAYKDMRIGGTLSDGNGTVLSFVRRKAAQKTQRDAADSDPIDDGRLSALLGTTNEAVFTRMFGLSHAELVRGGDALLKGGSELGQALFAAGAGVANLQSVQKELEKRAGELFKAGGSNPRINSILRNVKELDRRIRDAELKPSDWKAHEQARNESERRLVELRNSVRVAHADFDRLTRIRDAQPYIRRRNEARSALSRVADAPRLPAGFQGERRAAEAKLDAANIALRSAQSDLERLRGELDSLSLNDAVLQHEEGITACAADVRRIREAIHDRDTKIGPELKDLEARIERMRGELSRAYGAGFAGDEDLSTAPTLQQRSRLVAQGTKRDKAAEKSRALEPRLQEQRETLTGLQVQLGSIPPAVDHRPLKESLAAARRVEAVARRLDDDRALVENNRVHTEQMLDRLGGFGGASSELRALALPDDALLDRYRDQFDRVAQRETELSELKDKLEGQLADLTEKIDAIRTRGDVPTEAALDEARTLRDQTWSIIRAAWESGRSPEACAADIRESEAIENAGGIADRYEASVEQSDELSDRLRRESDRVSELCGADATRRRVESERILLESSRSELADERTRLVAEWNGVWATLRIESLPPREMALWLRKCRELIRAMDEASAIEREFTRNAQQVAEVSQSLTRALTALRGEEPEPASFEALMHRAVEELEKLESEDQLRASLSDRVGEARRALQKIDSESKSAARELSELDADWADALEQFGLSSATSLQEVHEVFAQTDAFVAAKENAQAHRDRIKAMTRAEVEFRSSTCELCAAIAPELSQTKEEDAIGQLQRLLNQTREARTRQVELKKQIDEAENRRKNVASRIAEHEADLQRFCREARVQSTDELAGAEERSQVRVEAERELAAAEEHLKAFAGANPFDDFIAMASAPPDGIETLLDGLERELERLDSEAQSTNELHVREKQWLESMDGTSEAGALAQERAEVVSALEEDVEEYVKVVVAAGALQAAMDRYRETNQGPVLERASRAFNRLTDGAFDGLMADYNAKGDQVIVGVRRGSGEKVQVDGMSEGTADQLYLALRLASIEEYVAHHPPMPVILDDILINFDDNRASAALSVLGELATHTQVIFFTHHRHLIDLAKQAVPADRLDVKILQGVSA